AESSMLLCILFLILACIPLPRFQFKGSAPLAPRPLPLYTLQPGDEVIAAEVFKAQNSQNSHKIPDISTGKGVSLPMPLQLTNTERAPAAGRRRWGLILARGYVG